MFLISLYPRLICFLALMFVSVHSPLLTPQVYIDVSTPIALNMVAYCNKAF